MKNQEETIKKKFDSDYKDIQWDSEFHKQIAFGHFKTGFLSSEDAIKKAGGKYKEAASLVLDYFNSEKKRWCPIKYTRGVAFTDSVQKVIVARFKEKFTIEDFKMVIDYKCHKWMGGDLEQYLRPSTLFSAKKFPEYVSESMHFKKPVRSKMDNDLDKLLEN